MIETTIQILLVMLGGVMGFCLHGIISLNEQDVGCIVIKMHKEVDDDKEDE